MRLAKALTPGELKDGEDEDRVSYWEWLFEDWERVEEWLDDPANIRSRGGTGGGLEKVDSLSKRPYYAACLAMCEICGDERAEEAEAYYRERLAQENVAADERAAEQEIEGNEKERWVDWGSVERNAEKLGWIAALYRGLWRNSGDAGQLQRARAWDMRSLVYDLYVAAADLCAFRLDVVYRTRVVDVDSSQGYGEKGEGCGSHFAYSQKNMTCQLHIVDYKTSKYYGTLTIPLSSAFLRRLLLSLSAFPREWFVCKYTDPSRPLDQRSASKFLKDAWVLDGRKRRPGADDMRSSVVTRFFATNQSLHARQLFASLSGASVATMEKHYYKTREDVRTRPGDHGPWIPGHMTEEERTVMEQSGALTTA